MKLLDIYLNCNLNSTTMYKYEKINEQKAVETWSPKLSEALGIDKKNSGKLKTLSILAEVKTMLDGKVNESEKRLMEAYGISTTANIIGQGPAVWGSDPGTGVGAQQGAWHSKSYKTGSGDIPTMIMGMAMNVAAYCVGLDLVTMIPVDMPTATFQFLDTVYAGGKTDAAGSAPIYIEVSADEIKNGFSYNTFTYGVDVFVTPVATGAIAAGKTLKATYLGKSFVSGGLLLKVDSTGDITTGGVYTPSASFTYSVAEVFSASNIITVGTSDTQADASKKIVISNGSADLVSSIRQHIAGASNIDGVNKNPMSREDTEAGNSNKLNLRLWSKTTEMKGEEIIADITKVQLRDLKAYGVDGMAQLYKAGQNQLIQTINDQIIDRMAQLGVKNHAQLLAAQGVNLNLFIAPAGTTSKAFTDFAIDEFVDPTGTDRRAEFGAIPNMETNSAAENTYTRQRRLYSRVLAGSSLIGTVGRYGKGDVAVVNSQISSALQDCQGFQAATISNTIGKTSDLHYIGDIGQVKVYENPKWIWNDTRIVIGYTGTLDSPGIKLLAYDLASTVEIISERTMAPKISILSRYSIIDAGFFPETNYLTIGVYNGFGSWI
jgi:hypothetical protein